ncbi:putative multicomponent Na+-H+ antiporter subunit A [alpha proteobacterium BAL199]|jgi:multicomponent Na+:H+ antiporter subunit B|nr:putative multicomponent Na+-H+ antiporter subunit A [alpha proteobacterium BAL199]
MELLINVVLLGLLGITAIAILTTRHLFVATMLAGGYSLTSAALLVNLDAVDVAFTEAAVGAGISTVLMLGTLTLTRRREKVKKDFRWSPFLVVLATGALLVYGTVDMPAFGDPNAPALQHIVPEYIAGTRDDIQIPNIVTAVLASYRGYDTLGETAVIFTAGVGVLLLLGRRREEDEEAGTRRPERDA